MQIQITNISQSPVQIRDLYTSIAVGQTVTTERSGDQIASMAGLQAALAAGTVTVSIQPTADEIGSGMLAPPESVQAVDIAPVSAAGLFGVPVLFRKAFAAGAAGTPDDVTIFAAGELPFQFRAVQVYGRVSTAVGASTLEIRSQAGGAGTLAGVLSSGSTGGVSDTTSTTTAVLTPGVSEGLFVRRSDRGVAGEIYILARREA